MHFSILFVDDDVNIVNSFKRTIRTKDLTIFTASNGVEALAILKKEKIEVLVTDIRMPEMDGISLLAESAHLYPDMIRIAISGEADKEDIKKLINHGHIWQYIEKPFNMGYLFVTIKNGYELYLERTERLKLIQQLDRKSKELEELNQKLEDRVSERTRQLTQRAAILQMIINGENPDDIFMETAKAISQSALVNNLFVHSPLLQNPFSFAPIPIPEDISEKIDSRYSLKEPLKEDFYITVPLLQNDETIALVTVHTTTLDEQEYEKIEEVTDFFVPMITMTLSHLKMLNDLPDLMDEIESMLGVMDNE